MVNDRATDRGLREPIAKSAYFDVFFFFNDTATTEIYTLSLHDALPIYDEVVVVEKAHIVAAGCIEPGIERPRSTSPGHRDRSEEHTSELQSH